MKNLQSTQPGQTWQGITKPNVGSWGKQRYDQFGVPAQGVHQEGIKSPVFMSDAERQQRQMMERMKAINVR